jgi:hypothetical protein
MVSIEVLPTLLFEELSGTNLRAYLDPRVLLIYSPLNNPLNNTMLYVLSKFISRVLGGIYHIHTFYMIREPAFAGSLSRAPMADNEKGFPRRIPFARNPHD